VADHITGISRTSLWNAWKEIRKNLKHASVRDVIDFLEYDIDPNVWINRLLRQLREGSYEPSSPRRFSLAKSKGFSRIITVPAIPDLVLYRAVLDRLYASGRRAEHKHVYFDRKRLFKVRQTSDSSVERDEVESDYRLVGHNRFVAWQLYDQYRKHLIFQKVYRFIVTTDITNFFDSILYSRVSDSLQGLSASRRLVGLLFFLLENLSVRESYSESPRIGLPVDEFDCSRKLAHLVLFPHDDRIVDEVGEDAYIRWMDDQNIGVSSRAQGLQILAAVGKSLGRLHLTPNAEKSRLLSLNEAIRHFHLRTNNRLDAAQSLRTATRSQRRKMRAELKRIWKTAAKREDTGEWNKVLKRFYRLAALARTKFLHGRAIGDILSNPELTRRVADYMRCTSKVSDYLQFVKQVWSHPEQVYPDVNIALVESLLRLEPNKRQKKLIRALAAQLLKTNSNLIGHYECAAVAPLLICRYGDRRSLPSLKTCFEHKIDRLPAAVIRSAAVVYLSYGLREFRAVRKLSARLFRNNLSEVIRLVERILEYDEVPGSYKARLTLRHDSLLRKDYFDMRSLLAARLLAFNGNRDVRSWLKTKKRDLLRNRISSFDKRLIGDLLQT
jgi:hypothetical protein